MAATATTHPSLLDWAKRLDPKGNIDTIVEILNEQNGILDDIVWVEGNLPTGHRTTIRTGIPTPTWRKLYGGVPPTKSTTAQVTDSCGMLESYAEVDKALADLNGNTAAFRLSEEKPHLEGMAKEFASTLFYGNEGTEPEAFTGFGPRFNDQSAANGQNILTSAATPDSTDNTSIWLVVWGPNTVHCIFPKGSKAGIQMEDKGQVTVEDASNGSNTGRMEAYRSHYRWDCGLTVRDWRYVVRVQYDHEDVIASGSSGPVLGELMREAVQRIPNLRMGRPAWYMNLNSLIALNKQENAKSTLAFQTVVDAQGAIVDKFLGIPIRRCDAILTNESGI